MLEIKIESVDNGYIFRCKKIDGDDLNRVYRDVKELGMHFPGVAKLLREDFEDLKHTKADLSFEEYKLNRKEENI